MIASILIPVNWALLGVLVVTVLYGLVWVATGRSATPETGHALGVFAMVSLLALLAGGATLLNVAARKRSVAGLGAITLALLWPVSSVVVRPMIDSYNKRRAGNVQAGPVHFDDPGLDAMALAISAGDSTTLTRLLDGKRPPNGTGRDGNDLLAFAIAAVRDNEGWSAPVRVLLAAGADPRTTTMASGENVVSFLAMGRRAPTYEAMKEVLEHGGDPNVIDPRTGNTPLGALHDNVEMARLLVEHGADVDRVQADGTPPVVRFIATRQWDTALYLIEKGARLDVVNAEGVSVNHYLSEWKENVFGQHPEGWDKVRAAIAARRR